jgi:diguanylate cyclase (GGDEF)-like protein/PAS domain S-box-containing protein
MRINQHAVASTDNYNPEMMLSGFLSGSSSRRVLIVGFGVVCLLMAALGATALVQMHANNRRLDQIVGEYNVKTAHVNDLRAMSRERALLVQNMLLVSDPFERDELMLRFRGLAGQYIRHRDALLAMHLSPEEARAIQASRLKIAESSRLMEEVVDLVLSGREFEADTLLIERAIPAQNEVHTHFNELVDLQNRATAAAVSAARAAYARAYGIVAFLGLAALGFALGISVLVVRRTAAAEHALAREKDRAEVTLHSIGDAVITTDNLGRIAHLNATAERLTGWPLEEARGHMVDEVYHVVDDRNRLEVFNPIASCLLGPDAVSNPVAPLLVARRGGEYAIEQSVSPIRERNGDMIGAVVVFRDVTTERSLAQELAWQASHDPLTGLVNRHEFERRLAALGDTARLNREVHVLLYVDLDQFKLVNDTCGHVAGDELLRQLATLLQTKIRSMDTLARLGGDEFGVLLPGCNITLGEAIAEKLRQEISEFRFVWADKTFAVGASIGLVEITCESGDLAALLSAADTACYMAKDRGRNRICVHQPHDADVRRRYGEIEWVNKLTQAFEEDRFHLYYQEIHPLPLDGGCSHREILLRMVDEKGQIVPPMAFIPAAERYSLMPTIDRWVVRGVLAWMRDNKESLIPASSFSINLSGQSLGDEAFTEFVLEELRRSEVDPRHICFEITETAAIANLTRAMRLMTALRNVGCRFSLDDFGSGMSSFAYLKNLPVDSIKIDGAFVRDMLTDPMDFAMVEAISRIGHVMGLTTIAEYVENDEIVRRLTELGVDYAQGFGVHRPEPLSMELPVAAVSQSL